MEAGCAPETSTGTLEAAGQLQEPPVQQKESEPVLLLGWREFPVDASKGELLIDGKPLLVEEEPNSGKGTGLVVWDGSLVLAKFLEHESALLTDAKVVELGSGTGVVGLACAALGARTVLLTDLEYTLANVRRNVQLNALEARASAVQLDWTQAALDSQFVGDVDVIVAADVVWVPDLVPPFVETLARLAKANPGLKSILIAHQTRSRLTDDLLFRLLEEHSFTWSKVSPDRLAPGFRSSIVFIMDIKLADPQAEK